MQACDRQLLEAYYDGEIDAEARRRVEDHLSTCRACVHELEQLKQSSRLLSEYPFADITEAELQAVHDAIDDVEPARIWRIGGSLGLIAASILIVGLAWLNRIPAVTGAPLRAQTTAPTPPWERIAMTLRADPYRPPAIQLADAQATDAQLADWMLEGLSASGRFTP